MKTKIITERIKNMEKIKIIPLSENKHAKVKYQIEFDKDKIEKDNKNTPQSKARSVLVVGRVIVNSIMFFQEQYEDTALNLSANESSRLFEGLTILYEEEGQIDLHSYWISQ